MIDLNNLILKLGLAIWAGGSINSLDPPTR